LNATVDLHRSDVPSTKQRVGLLEKFLCPSSVIRSCFKNNTGTARPRPRSIFLVSDRSCPKTDGLRQGLF